MSFYTNTRSNVSLVKQTVDMIFTSRIHTCYCNDFICIQSFIYEHSSERADDWYHVYRIDDFTMKFVRCKRTAKTTAGSILGYLGPSYYTETDDIFEVNMLEMLDNINRIAYQKYVNNITLYRGGNIRVIFHSYSDNSSSKRVDLELRILNSLDCNPKFLFEKLY